MMKILFQNHNTNLRAIFLVCAVTLLAGCNQQNYSSPEGYDLSKPQLMQLGKVLNEISGITYNTENNTLLAVSDSKEKVFEINIERRKLKDFTERVVGSRSDLEDIVKVDSGIFLLSSHGILYQIPSLKHVDTAQSKSFSFSADIKNDFESIYYDVSINGLVILCKTCASSKEGTHPAYRFDLSKKKFDSTALYTIDDKDVQAKLKDNGAKFLPSAAAIHPITKKLFILASAGNLLVIADRQGQPLEAYHLNPNNFPQAEGIAFAPNGDMYISNEGKYGGKATLQIFPYHTSTKK
ncbi:MAG: SdiA-regulated domain-containing protein [Flavisolibacter sp.]